ncbi:hypothetical protein P7K49_028094 [Saguinus oedipus]|uniref:Uncharacterized protein n=1 Tax=Saguinus oedipus TaxID=9490 RepID=A0ABQ9UBS3_SAGOE|nr:hypothetical protein P7K49_028094 [Saguinus oedipus]
MNPKGREQGRRGLAAGWGEDCAGSAPKLEEEVVSVGVYGSHGDQNDFLPTRPPLPAPLPREKHHGNQTSASRKQVSQVATVGGKAADAREVKGPTPKVVIVLSPSPRIPDLAEPSSAPEQGFLEGNRLADD